MKSSVVQDQKVTLEDGEGEDPKVHRAPEEDPGQKDLLVNLDQQDQRD